MTDVEKLIEELEGMNLLSLNYNTAASVKDRCVASLRRLALAEKVVEAHKKRAALDAREARYRREYPAGSCNAEDAWRELSRDQHQADADVAHAVAALDAAKGTP